MKRRDMPIVVCGPARSGTTAVRAMLNSHPDISIAREVPLDRLPSLRPLLEEIAEHHRDRWTQERRAEVVRGLWFAASRPLRSSSNSLARRWGMKTPWSELDSDLWDSLVSPVYVYAMRRGDRVFRSHIRLGWGTDSPAGLIDRYKKSLAAFEKLRSRGVAHIVRLDRVDSPEDRRRMGEEVFAFLGESLDESRLDAIAGFSARLNSPTSEPGEEPRLPDEWQELLTMDSEYQELMSAHGY
jgi:hypothetical protein